jgi:hypothetical protein
MLTLAEAREWFYCDFEAGVLFWKKSSKSITKNAVAGTVKPSGYRTVNFRRKTYLAHRLIWLLYSGSDPYPYFIDHINGVKHDNRIINLRLATNAENTRNQKLHPKNTSGYKGVSFIKKSGKWDARIKKDYIQYCIGVYNTKEEAHAAYCEAARRLHGEFARSS